jgi:hypothetical protein
MTRINVDTAQVRRLGNDLGDAAKRLDAKVTKIVRVGAAKIKKGMREDFKAQPLHPGPRGARTHVPGLPPQINYDIARIPGAAVRAEIGVDKDGQGNLANFLAFGSSNNPPTVDHTAALHREKPLLIHYLESAAEESVLGQR